MDFDKLITEALHPGHFYVADGFSLHWQPRSQATQRWEIFRGRLLDPAHTREEKTFEEWNIIFDDAKLFSIKIDVDASELHLTRAVECYVHEGYDSGGGVILTREVTKWVNELIATIDLNQPWTETTLQTELEHYLFRAVIGLSRLPLTSVEAPLPAFTFGQLFYLPQHREEQSACIWKELLELVEKASLQRDVTIKALEFLLRITSVEHLLELRRLSSTPLQSLQRMFNQVSLSPWTNLVDNALSFAERLREENIVSIDDLVDFYSLMLRQLARHLTAFDLITFHHRGANYPDALFLDALFKQYLHHLETHPALFEGDSKSARLRRRALRQGWMLRRFYEGHPVPDAPTSPGEMMRVLPDSHPRVPEEQIEKILRRKRRLYQDDPIPMPPVLNDSFKDLQKDSELRELGTALFLDRSSILLSHLAFSRNIAHQRLQWFCQQELLTQEQLAALETRLEHLQVNGIGLDQIQTARQPGTVSVLDAAQVSDDFVYFRTTDSSMEELRQQHQFPTSIRLLLPSWDEEVNRPILVGYDQAMSKQWVLKE